MKPLHKPSNIIGFLVASFLLVFGPLNAQATAPPLWEPMFGSELTDLTGVDDGETNAVPLSFLFPFAGGNYMDIFVGTNGGLQLGSLGSDDEIDYDLWNDFDEFNDDWAPILCPLCTDLDLHQMGMVFFNDFGNRAVVTWDGVGSYENKFAPFTFQTQLFDNGQILMSWYGIPLDLQSDLSEGIIVGISESNNVDPGHNHFLTDTPFSGSTTIYEIWCYDDIGFCGNIDGDQENPTNGFPLDGKTLRFTPYMMNASYGYDVDLLMAQGPAPVPEPATMVLLSTGIVGLIGYRRLTTR